ncbi:uncharacterized protein LOC129908975 [Episyrphus balteatus]|uniref:uncharacterized protein LOC129908975 n=1 Tax=Episyrphus balteatus TaxID=286459 RepID=UPI002485A5CF|nr:uncharacterized protein LOC129908975 [Episyrphus balteatus]
MYNSIPVTNAEESIKNWLETINTLDNSKVNEYMRLVHLCFSKNYVQFNGEVYEQIDGLAMGNPLSAFAANCFMAEFETKAKKNCPDFPFLWVRYVDDTYIIIHKDKLNVFLNFLNNVMHGIIKFTFETEVNFCLPFLDLMVKRVESYLEFDIYRKPTNTDRCIPSNSYHPNQTEFAAFNSYCYRAVHVPLNKNNFIKEMETIHRIATMNGYSIKIVNSLLKKHIRKKELRDFTTLVSNKEKAITYMGGTFVEGLTYSLMKVLNNYSIKLSPNSTGNKIKTLIGTVKDKTDTLDKSGIYSVICQDCNEVYIGQTRRTAKIRW